MIVRTTCLHAKVRVFPACGEVHHLSGKRVWVVTFLPPQFGIIYPYLLFAGIGSHLMEKGSIPVPWMLVIIV